ncbi:ATP-binding protein [Clostridium sp.]|uniref:sensor histidine kinase n=1 Tax=Clostridium sp. TaxID=1506 RepID=UPI0034642320
MKFRIKPINIKNSITKWLFSITAIALFIFLIFSMIFQSLFFEKFYIRKKQDSLESSLKNFKLAYSYSLGNNTLSIVKSLENLEVKNNAKVAILNTNGEISYLSNANNEIDPNIKRVIIEVFREYISNEDLMNDMYKNNSILSSVVYNKSTNTKNLVCISPISFNNAYDNIIIAISPFQPIAEASAVIKDFYIYLFLFALIVIFVLSYIYTKLIAKPLVDLNKAALKMCNLSFDEKCEIYREDEIGNLSRTLNFLSLNLSGALNELKDANIKLKNDIEKEKELENMRKEFIAGVSHELKTPITLIEGYAEGLKDGIVKDEDMDFYLEVIMDESKKMNALVRDMLELSRLESPNFQLKLESFPIDVLINKVIKPFKTYIEDKSINLILNFSNDSYAIGDKVRIEQVITNFFTNAIRHTPRDGNIIITVEHKNKTFIIAIENTGENIKEEYIENIWSQFYKIDKSRNRSFGGTGLGLSISKNILTLHNSNFGVKNTDTGVRFYFTLEKSSPNSL